MNLGIDGKLALVTGGMHGIGAGIVQALREEGARVVYTTRNEPIDLWGIQANRVTDDLEPDILVNNAGHTLDVLDPHCGLEDWREVLQLNFESAVRLIERFLPSMKRKGWGRIVNITSCAGLENAGPVPYCVAKAMLTAYTHSMGRVLATECEGVVMTAVYPSIIKTEGGHWDKASPEHTAKYLSERIPTGRFQEIDEFSHVVAFYCSDHASACHGAIIAADQGQSRHFSPHNYLSGKYIDGAFV